MDEKLNWLNTRIPFNVISLPVSLSKSMQGNYFLGQTDMLILGEGNSAWGGLINPSDSGVNLFVNVTTISNFSDLSFKAEAWFNPKSMGKGVISTNVTASNTTLYPMPNPKVQLEYVQSTTLSPKEGVNPFCRIVSANQTLVSEDQGKFIIPPGGSYIIFLSIPEFKLVKAQISFGWWEEKIRH